MNAKEYVQRLNEILNKKLSLMEELLLFARSQKKAISEGRLEDNDTLINEKQLRMDAVDNLDQQFLVYASRLKSLLSISSFEQLPQSNIPGTAELKSLTVKIHELIGQIKDIETENINLINKELERTKEIISHTSKFRRVTGAYHPASNETPSYYFDKKK